MKQPMLKLSRLSIFAALGALTFSGCGGADDPEPAPQLEARSLYQFNSCEQLRSYTQEQLLAMLDKSWDNQHGGVWGAPGGGWVPDFDDADSAVGESAGGDAPQGEPSADQNNGASESPKDSSSGGGAPDHSNTNVQVEGVDEPDIVKTDGRRIIAVTRGELIVVDVSGMTPVITDRVEIEGKHWGGRGEAFLHGNKVLLIDRAPRADVPASAWPESWKTNSAQYQGVVRILEFDISQPGQAKVLRKLHIDGDYISARKIGGVARLVLQTQVQAHDIKSPYQFLSNGGGKTEPSTDPGETTGATGPAFDTSSEPSFDSGSDSGSMEDSTQGGSDGGAREFRQGDDWNQRWEEAKNKAREYNKGVVAKISEKDVLPSFVREDLSTGVSQVQNGLLYNCEQAMRPGVESGVAMLSVLTLDLDAGIAPSSAMGIMATGQTVYSSTQGLYVATQPWSNFPGVAWGVGGDVDNQEGVNPGVADDGDGSTSTTGVGIEQPVEAGAEEAGRVEKNREFRQAEAPKVHELTTYIHKFDVSDPKLARYVASGSVNGRLLNQFAMSEQNGDLRVAATRQENWRPKDSFVAVLRPEGDTLKELSRVGKLGPTETIRSVRFMGDTAYVVTFRQTDPLYTINLKDPMAPVVMGELKIEGYSAYLHPIAPGYLLGVGRDANAEGMERGLQVSVFDVRNLAAPSRLYNYTLAGAHSQANWDHHAFLYWPKTQTAVIPVQQWWWDAGDTDPATGEPKSGKSQNFTGGLVLDVDVMKGISERGRIEHEGVSPFEYPKEKWEGMPEQVEMLPKRKAQLERAVVIGDLLYTMSWAGLKANSLLDGREISWTDFSDLK